MSAKLLCVVSDLHCGSDVALCPPEIKSEKGNVTSFGDNRHHAWLWDNWRNGADRVRTIAGKDPIALLINGDAIEGVHHRNNKDLVAQDMERHIAMTRECLKQYDFCRERYVVAGTECHTQGLESLLAKEIKAKTAKAKDKWLIEMHGCLVDAAHHMGTTSRAYLEASLMSIHMGNARVNYERSGHRVPKVFLRGHRHCGGHYCDGSGLFAVTGAWQFLTRHGFKVVTDSIPRPNVLVLDWRNKERGELPSVHESFFTPPQDEIHKC